MKQARFPREKGLYAFVEPRRLSLSEFRLDHNGFLITEEVASTPIPDISTASRQWFRMPDEELDCFAVSRRGGKRARQDVFFFYGWKVVVEYYDTNVILQPVSPFNDDAPSLDDVVGRIFRFLRSGYRVIQYVSDTSMFNVGRMQA